MANTRCYRNRCSIYGLYFAAITSPSACTIDYTISDIILS